MLPPGRAYSIGGNADQRRSGEIPAAKSADNSAASLGRLPLLHKRPDVSRAGPFVIATASLNRLKGSADI